MPPSGSTPGRLSQALKEALRASGKSMYTRLRKTPGFRRSLCRDSFPANAISAWPLRTNWLMLSA